MAIEGSLEICWSFVEIAVEVAPSYSAVELDKDRRGAEPILDDVLEELLASRRSMI